jgi:hypothetical protein
VLLLVWNDHHCQLCARCYAERSILSGFSVFFFQFSYDGQAEDRNIQNATGNKEQKQIAMERIRRHRSIVSVHDKGILHTVEISTYCIPPRSSSSSPKHIPPGSMQPWMTFPFRFLLLAAGAACFSHQHHAADAFAPSHRVAVFPALTVTVTRPAPTNPFLQHSSTSSPSSPSTGCSTGSSSTSLHAIELASLLYDSTSTAFDAWEWTANLGAPAALVAGAVLVTLSENRVDMAPRRQDKKWVRLLKQTCRFLLLSSFALEVVSIFVSTVTGTVLLSHGEQLAKATAGAGAVAGQALVGYTSPLGLLHHHHEFEYLTIRIAFLQGLFHWLAAVAMEVMVPKEGENVSARRMNAFMASCLVSLILWILAFYNHHLSFYGDYGGMLRRYVLLFAQRFFGAWPPRPMTWLYGPSFVTSIVLGWRAFTSPPDLDEN